MAMSSLVPGRALATDIARDLLRAVQPRRVQRDFARDFALVEDAAFGDPLAGLMLGEDGQSLMGVADVLRAMADVFDAHEALPARVRTPDELVQLLVESLSVRLATGGNQTAAVPFLNALDPVLRGRPSMLDLLAGTLFSEPAAKRNVTLRECEQALERCTLKITTDDQDGRPAVSTGFVLSNREHMNILTACHVVGKVDTARVAWRVPDPRERRTIEGRARVVYRDPKNDVAVLEADTTTQDVFSAAGISAPALAIREDEGLRRLRTMCLGYQDHDFAVDALGVACCTPLFFPVREIGWRGESTTQRVLILVVQLHDGQLSIAGGTSGAPLIDLQTAEVVGMVIGTLLRADVLQPWTNKVETISAPAFGFAVPLNIVAESRSGGWPEFESHCGQYMEG
jgi:hypothetical protein